jgi:hypothetical protein
MNIEICKQNRAALKEALATHQGAGTRRNDVKVSTLSTLAEDAEHLLDCLDVPPLFRFDARYTFAAGCGGYLCRATDTTKVVLMRNVVGWSLVDVSRFVQERRHGEIAEIKLTPSQAGILEGRRHGKTDYHRDQMTGDIRRY